MNTTKRILGAIGLTIIGLTAGNLVGLVLVSIWGWEGLSYEKPGGVALAAVQSLMGVLIVQYAIERFYDEKLARKAILIAGIAMLAIMLVSILALSIYIDFSQVLKWNTLAGLAYAAVLIFSSKK